MKTLLTILGLSALIASAADQPSPIANVKPEPPGWAFGSKEVIIESYYTARFSGSFNDADQGIGFGVGYALNDNIVASVNGVSYLDSVQGVNEILGRISYRAPLKFLSVKLAPYAFTYGGGNLQTGIGFAGAGGGIEWRPIWKQLGVFGEADLRIDTEWESSVGISTGVRLNF